MATYNGGPNADVFGGTSGDDTAYGNGGDDQLSGAGGDDTLDGGDGRDRLFGGGGDDTIFADVGDATVDGGTGIDTLVFDGGGEGDDATIDLSRGMATIERYDGDVSSVTFSNFENVTASGRYVHIIGDDGANRLIGSDGGDDVIIGGLGDDYLDGRGVFHEPEEDPGRNTVSYEFAAGAEYIDLVAGTASGGDGNDTLRNFQIVIGSAYNDTIVSSGANYERLKGGGGDDVIYGKAREVEISGGSGYDRVTYETLDHAVDMISDFEDQPARDLINTDVEEIDGSAFADRMTGAHLVMGLAGNDQLQSDVYAYAKTAATLNGGDGDDTLTVQYGDDTLIGGAGSDTARFNGHGASGVTVDLSVTTRQDTGAGTVQLSGIENLTGSSHNDTLIGDGGDNVLTGGNGDDTLNGGGGSDTASYAGTPVDYNHPGVTVSLAVSGAQATGAAGSDTLVSIENLIGTSGTDTLIGNAGNNRLAGGSGNDSLRGGAGNDTLDGGAGTDRASYADATSGVRVDLSLTSAQDTGGAGTDTLVSIEIVTGSDYADTLIGSSKADELRAGAGDDVIRGGLGGDLIDGGAGIDRVSYTDATSGVTVSLATAGQQQTGGAGNDTLISIESLTGSSYADVLTGSSGANVIQGFGGNDVINAGAGNDTIDGGGGVDKASYKGASAAVSVSLAITAAQNTGGAGTDTLIAIENLLGSSYDDALIGSSAANVLAGDTGSDVLNGGAGDDTLDGGSGSDKASYKGATAAVSVSLAIGGAQNTGGAGTDTLVSIENLLGSAYDDTLVGSSAANVLSGDAGNDVINGGADNDTIDGGGGVDKASYKGASAAVKVDLTKDQDQATGGGGTDQLRNIENLLGSSYGDTLTGSTAGNAINGDAGNDTLDGGLGMDKLTGGAGDDTFRFTTTLGTGNIDTIADFSAAHDTIGLGFLIFSGLETGVLESAAFYKGAAAHDADDRIIYNASTGALLFDRDGTGSEFAAVEFATVGKNLGITAANFVVG